VLSIEKKEKEKQLHTPWEGMRNGKFERNNDSQQPIEKLSGLYKFNKQWPYLFLALVLAVSCSVTWDSKGNVIRPQRVSVSCTPHMC